MKQIIETKRRSYKKMHWRWIVLMLATALSLGVLASADVDEEFYERLHADVVSTSLQTD